MPELNNGGLFYSQPEEQTIKAFKVPFWYPAQKKMAPNVIKKRVIKRVKSLISSLNAENN
jgi:hypothetical protein